MWVVIHICMETAQGISLYSYLHLKPGETLCFSFCLICFSSTKLENKRAEQVLPGGGGGGGGGSEVGWWPKIMCTHVSKCKNNEKIISLDSSIFRRFVLPSL
jgi:hypothetical protein